MAKGETTAIYNVKLTPRQLAEIYAREELEEAEYAAWSELPHDHQYDHVNMELYREACEDRAALLRHVEALESVLAIKSEFLSSRQCPDHSGKWPRGRCLQCEIEAAERKLARLVERLKGLPTLGGPHSNWYVTTAELSRAIDEATGEGK